MQDQEKMQDQVEQAAIHQEGVTAESSAQAQAGTSLEERVLSEQFRF